MNICGCLVHVTEEAAAFAPSAIEAFEGVEIHARGDDGRLVVVVEDTEGQSAADKIMALHQIPGVISLTLHYHHFENLSQREPLAATQPEI